MNYKGNKSERIESDGKETIRTSREICLFMDFTSREICLFMDYLKAIYSEWRETKRRWHNFRYSQGIFLTRYNRCSSVEFKGATPKCLLEALTFEFWIFSNCAPKISDTDSSCTLRAQPQVLLTKHLRDIKEKVITRAVNYTFLLVEWLNPTHSHSRQQPL